MATVQEKIELLHKKLEVVKLGGGGKNVLNPSTTKAK